MRRGALVSIVSEGLGNLVGAKLGDSVIVGVGHGALVIIIGAGLGDLVRVELEVGDILGAERGVLIGAGRICVVVGTGRLGDILRAQSWVVFLAWEGSMIPSALVWVVPLVQRPAIFPLSVL